MRVHVRVACERRRAASLAGADRFYYSNRLFLGFMCAGNEGFYLCEWRRAR